MDPRISELLDYAEAQRQALLLAVAEVPQSTRDTRPGPESWSVAEVLEHLHLVERNVARLVSKGVAQARVADPPPASERRSAAGAVLASLDTLRLTQRGPPVRAPERVSPRGELTAAAAEAALVESRAALREALFAGDGLPLELVSVPHPIYGPLDLYQWALFVGQHEARHTAQIREIGRTLRPTGTIP